MEKSLSITVILKDGEEDVFSVMLQDGQGGMYDVTGDYEVVSATHPDGRQGVFILGLEEADDDGTNQIDPYDMPKDYL